MYVPTHFASEDAAIALALMADHPFATLIVTGKDGAPSVSHLPLLVERENGALRITGHVARANPQAALLMGSPAGLAIFHGPHAYVSSRWYEGFDVPTWNYAVVHAHGRLVPIDNERRLAQLLAGLAERFESDAKEPWRFGLPDDLRAPGALAAAILGFELVVGRLETKLKLSQNRSATDRANVIEALGRERTDEGSRGVRTMMLKEGGR